MEFKQHPWNSIYNILLNHSKAMQASKKSKVQRSKQTPRKPKYDVISYEKRKELIDLVIQDHLSIYRASRITGINNATAKVILKKYRKDGAIFVRKSEREQIHQAIESSQQQCSAIQYQKSVQQQAPVLVPQFQYQSALASNYLYQSMAYLLYPTYYVYNACLF